MVRGGQLIIITVCLLLSFTTYASDRDTSHYRLAASRRDSVPQKDLMDMLHSYLHFGSSSSRNDSVELKPVMSVVPAIGYALQSRMAILLSGNVAFRTSANARISVVNFSTSYTQNAQFTLPLLWNIWSKNNSYNFIGDVRFYAYPQNTFGLGSNSERWKQNPMDYNYFRFSETALRHIAGNLYIGAGYVMDNHWGISHQSPISIGFPGFSNYN